MAVSLWRKRNGGIRPSGWEGQGPNEFFGSRHQSILVHGAHRCPCRRQRHFQGRSIPTRGCFELSPQRPTRRSGSDWHTAEQRRPRENQRHKGGLHGHLNVHRPQCIDKFNRSVERLSWKRTIEKKQPEILSIAKKNSKQTLKWFNYAFWRIREADFNFLFH